MLPTWLHNTVCAVLSLGGFGLALVIALGGIPHG